MKLVYEGNELSFLFPEVAKEWHPTKNDPLTPDMVTPGCNKRVWWRCSVCGHEWQTSVNHRTSSSGRGPTGCPKCAARLKMEIRAKEAAETNNMAEQYPHLAEQWHTSKNGDLKATDVSVHSNKKVWWKCDICGNEWETTVNHRTRDAKRGLGCPRCAKTGSSFPEQAIYYYVSKHYDDALIRDKSAIGIELDVYVPSIKTAIEYDGQLWHNKEDKLEKENKKDHLCKENGIVLIRFRDERLKDTDNAVRITCKDADEAELNKAIFELMKILRVSDCDIDVSRDYYDIVSCFKTYNYLHSLEYLHPELLDEWDYNKNSIEPSKVLCYRREKYWWKCKTCGNEWQTDIGHRIGKRNCPVCALKIQGQKRSEAAAKKNNFAMNNPDLLKQWHPTKNGNLDPYKLASSSQKKAWWVCPDCGHEWSAIIATRTKGYGCPECGRIKAHNSRLENYAKKNNLLKQYPDLCEEWHPTKNGDRTPEKYSVGSHTKVWWQCSKCGFEWETEIKVRTLAKCGCPRCAGKI